jgi:hypothetical protein
VLIGETIINIFFLPAFDHELGGGVAFSQWLVTRTLTLPVTVITNIIFIYSIYRIVAQTIHYDYRHDMLEVMGTDLMVE